MDDLTYEYQRMISRSSEIREIATKKGWEAAWEGYSRMHGIDQQRFRSELPKLRARFQGIATNKK
ncbi:MAG TPA: hypothetical protein VGQ76_19435 [Thermoanaerobaculia bacterium]|jgi:hypothetical protein|nr:hypothetical protein [Thermoanaerobaculia bacterium]